jgi:hypothetical protein
MELARRDAAVISGRVPAIPGFTTQVVTKLPAKAGVPASLRGVRCRRHECPKAKTSRTLSRSSRTPDQPRTVAPAMASIFRGGLP